MRKTYNVAGHSFAIVMPDDNEFWNEMGNYEPFLTQNSEDCDFVVEQIETLPDLSEKKKITISFNGPEYPRYDIYDWNGLLLLEGAPTFTAPICYRMLMDKGFSKVQFQIEERWRFSFNRIVELMFSFATASKWTIQIHASVTMKDDKGYLFLGPSGTGKSTHSQLWINNIEGSSLLNDDNPVIRIGEDGVARVYGTPWSGKTPCYRNLNVPIGALVILHQAKENAIKRLPIAKAYAELYSSFTGMKFIKELGDAYHATNLKLVTTVPFYELDCLPNPDAAFLCYKTVSQQ